LGVSQKVVEKRPHPGVPGLGVGSQPDDIAHLVYPHLVITIGES
jgi:hypothetical protein